MIIIASLAGAFDLFLAHSHLDGKFTAFDRSMVWGSAWRLGSLWLGIAAIAWLALRLRRPRPPLADLASQPGFSACAVGALILAYRFLSLAVLMAIIGVPDAEELYTQQIRYYGLDAGLAIGCVWLIQAVGRSWRPQPNWLDRTGRAIGALWLLISLIAGAANGSANLLIWRERVSPSPGGIFLNVQPRLLPMPVAPGSAGVGNAHQNAAIPSDPGPTDDVQEEPEDPASPPE